MLQIAWVGVVILLILVGVISFGLCIKCLIETIQEREWAFTGLFIVFILLIIVYAMFAVATFPGWSVT